ncbi:MAG: mycofactocin system FadH/OYE family oxidoreductase 2 [Firmicutes bacterium]|nr:mycofactocin system FadH/OYE family oxidoreductase 2 [Bacillota bacterium]
MEVHYRLLSPLDLGKKNLKNRIIFGPHRTNFAVKNLPGEKHADYYEQRAKGGVGLIIVEGGSVHPSDYPYEKVIFAYARDAVFGYSKIAKAVHRHGCLVVAQLNHYGGQADGSLSRREIWAPSPVPEVNSGEIPKVMETEDIEEIIESFVQSSLIVCEAGMDGVEINMGQCSLLRQFLSPLTNFRTDEYGGSLENRARFCMGVLKKVRQKIGQDFIIGLRLCGDEYAPWGGLTPDCCLEAARYICRESGLIDYLAVEVGSIYSLHMTMASMRHPEDYAVGPARLIAGAVDVPVCATGSIRSVELAEKLLHEKIKLVDMARALIADPQLPEKARSGKLEQIRPCILCNEGCYVYSTMNPVLTCAVNPSAGQEKMEQIAGAKKVNRKKSVAVIGGGPAGLEAAGTAAERGWRVVLYEKNNEPGGRLVLAAKIPGWERSRDIINHLYERAIAHGVEMRLGCEVSESIIEKERYDAIIVATGSKPSSVPFRTEDGVKIWTADDILEDRVGAGNSIVIIDLEGAWQAVGAALVAAERFKKIIVLAPEMFVSPELAKNGEFVIWYQQAFRKGIELIPQTEVIKVSKSGVEVLDCFSRNKWLLTGIDTVVLAAPRSPETGLYKKMTGKGIKVWAIGDCVAPRNLSAAIREGRIAGLKI